MMPAFVIIMRNETAARRAKKCRRELLRSRTRKRRRSTNKRRAPQGQRRRRSRCRPTSWVTRSDPTRRRPRQSMRTDDLFSWCARRLRSTRHRRRKPHKRDEREDARKMMSERKRLLVAGSLVKSAPMNDWAKAAPPT